MENLKLNKIYNMDCLEGVKLIPDKSIDLICIDPPYNIGKDKWDKWKSVEDYVEWMGKVFKECERVLKDTGSFYWFHNDFEQIVELQYWLKRNTKFVFRNFIVWNKKFKGCNSEAYLDIAIATDKNRTYRKFAEYCLFYTFDDVTDLDYSHIALEVYKPIRDYIQNMLDKSGYKWKDKVIVDTFLNNGFGKNYFNARQIAQNKLNTNYSQFRLMSEKEYDVLMPLLKFDRTYQDLKQEWDALNKEYRRCRKEYKKENKNKLQQMRYTFNKQKNHSVWEYQTPSNKLHICEKPVNMIEDIIKTSSNEGDVVLDLFMGSGTTAVACINTKRNYIGFEQNVDYYNTCTNRLNNLS